VASRKRFLFEAYGALISPLYDRLIAPALEELALGLGEALFEAPPAGAPLLDVGCGGGQLLVHLARRRPELRLVGLDLSTPQLARARRRVGGVARLVRGSALALPFRSATFGAVVSIASLKHWPDPRLGLAECARVLRPGGRLVVAEGDRDAGAAESRAFVARYRLPALARRLALPGFRRYVLGISPTVAEARAWLATLPLAETRAERVPGTPFLVLSGRSEARRPGA